MSDIDETWLRAHTATLPGAVIAMKPEWDALVGTVAGTLFALLGENAAGQEILTLKGLPEDNLALRHTWSAVIPGYYMNKQHWNSILLHDAATLPDGLLVELVEQSYHLVFSKLPKRTQREITGAA